MRKLNCCLARAVGCAFSSRLPRVHGCVRGTPWRQRHAPAQRGSSVAPPNVHCSVCLHAVDGPCSLHLVACKGAAGFIRYSGLLCCHHYKVQTYSAVTITRYSGLLCCHHSPIWRPKTACSPCSTMPTQPAPHISYNTPTDNHSHHHPDLLHALHAAQPVTTR
jgi:hypothetical protein